MPDALRFFIPGIPKATQTGSIARLPNGRTFPMRRNTGWSEYCGLIAQCHAPDRLLQGPLSCRLTFYFTRAKSAKRIAPTMRPDLDNLVKGLLDKWNGVLWPDDSAVTELIVRKEYGTQPGLAVSVWPDPRYAKPTEVPLTMEAYEAFRGSD